ncbi:DUF4982 domain-containing protein [Acetivibrio cellulolyticus]|uniref:DUF4982 domain-containing protein n=1 Tax=Acetivibrio cellulolyticus TaxID=35830 RepID=UPI0001E2D955|nr:DUF4982 domain-containing protein [Acetivibrio cellulolyticus]
MKRVFGFLVAFCIILNLSSNFSYSAKSNQTTSLKYGDLNGDGSFNSIDFALMRSFLLGIIPEFPVSNGSVAADVNADEQVNAIDFALMRSFLLGIITEFPADKMPIATPTATNPSVTNPATDMSASTYSLDPGWKFIRQDVSGAQAASFADNSWSTVSTPHTYNDVDSYTKLISHSSGNTGSYTGPAWYRKHFKIPSKYSSNKIIIEFERIRQGARFYINGKEVGVYDDGVTACGIDLTGKVNFGDTENVLAVRVDNSNNYVESSTGVGFQWQGKAFNPNYGGLIGHVWLHMPGNLYQTYPLYNNLKTSGIYIYPSDFTNLSPSQGDLTVNVESEVRNESDSSKSVILETKVMDTNGTVATTFRSTATTIANGQTTIIKAKGQMTNAKLWSDQTPNLYNVVTNLIVDGVAVNSRTTTTGFRKVEFRGGTGTGGVYINGRFVFLLGYAQRASNDWAALGQAVPDWMHEYDANLIKGSNSNYIRWMHISPQDVDVKAHDRAGIIDVVPAGDKEKNVIGVQWQQRKNVMRASMIYLRNNPSVIMWENGNFGIPADQMKEMYDIKKQWDPSGWRGIGVRNLTDQDGIQYSDWFGTMVGFDPAHPNYTSNTDTHRGYALPYRDKGPIIECEDFRDEALRGIWDKYSPPHYGFKKGANDTWNWDSETIIPNAVNRLNIWLNTYNIKNKDSEHSRFSGYASIYFADSNAHGRQQDSTVCHVSGKVDSVRLPKQLYYAHRVCGNPQPDIHIVGHWNYPSGTTKTMYVVSNTASVELFVNGTSIGKSSKPADRYLFSFPNVKWAAGTIKAVGYDNSGKQVAQYEMSTAGAPAKIKLTPTVGPNGLQANGADVVMYDVEVVDANGNRCPTDESRIDFTMTGPGIWRGGVNADTVGSVNKTYLSTECGINRVFIRSTLTPGTITLTATRNGLTSDTVSVSSKPISVVDGISPALDR